MQKVSEQWDAGKVVCVLDLFSRRTAHVILNPAPNSHHRTKDGSGSLFLVPRAKMRAIFGGYYRNTCLLHTPKYQEREHS